MARERVRARVRVCVRVGVSESVGKDWGEGQVRWLAGRVSVCEYVFMCERVSE